MSYNVRSVFLTLKNNIFFKLALLIPIYFLRFFFFAIKEGSLMFYRFYPGYHGSTIPSLKGITRNSEQIFRNKVFTEDGINLNKDNQIQL